MNGPTPGQATRDLRAEEVHRAFADWMEARGFHRDHAMVCGGDRMQEAFTGGMQAERDLAAGATPVLNLAEYIRANQELARSLYEATEPLLHGTAAEQRLGRELRERHGLEV